MLLAISSLNECGSIPLHSTRVYPQITQILLRQCGEALERISVKRLCLPGGLVPHAILIADDLHGHDHTIATELIVRRDAIVELSARRDSKLHRPRQLVIPEQFELVVARI